jgi:endo-1,4-beta-xylanase
MSMSSNQCVARRWLPFLATAAVCSVSSAAQAAPEDGRCGYSVSTGIYSNWGSGYQGWVEVTNRTGAVATTFSLLLDIGTTTLADGYQATFTPSEGGYRVQAPSWLQYQTIPVGGSYRFGFIGQGQYQGHAGYIRSVNGAACDVAPPSVELAELPGFLTSDGVLTLSASASDDVAVRKVVFARDGVVVGEALVAPFQLDVPIGSSSNGRHTFTATVTDWSGNASSDSASVLVAIGNRFLGTAVGAAVDYEDLLTYFDQLTPGNAGKWGSVEAERDVMSWAALDEAYAFARNAGIPFKLHTLVWGQQQPAWLTNLPPAEQLEELNEWMAALAERYGDLPLIDVVNEPINAPPPYAEALGGAGVTGYDWVIEAFRLARTYFPRSELLLNEYRVLILESFTHDYLDIIELLQAEGLIDGISEQGHFLERADVDEVASNLALLAATGLPIYVSEFDVDFADDIRQANVFRDLFSVFWENPSVLGVTHWGHLQGSTWRTNAYLIRQDKSERPALQWLECYLAGGTDCTVPAYVPGPWVGDEFGVTLQAELYDEASGVLALGDAVSYTDEGDWLEYSSVLFDGTWDTFSVTYAKGNTEVGSISVHLDSLDTQPVLEVPLEPTAGWGSSTTLEVAWPSVTGAHAVYVRFNDVSGVANVDSLRFGKQIPDMGVELVANGDFETDASGWYSWNGTVSVSSARAQTGNQSLRVSGGTATGPAAINLLGLAEPGVTYGVRFWVSVGGNTASQVNITQAMTCGAATSYSWIANDGAVPSDGWVELTGSLTIPADCDLQMLQVYAEGSGAGVDLYVDNVSIQGPPPTTSDNLIANGDFEQDTSGWFSWIGAVSASTTKAYTGAQSLRVSGSGTGPAATDASSVARAGASYRLSFWTSVGNVESAPVNITRALTCGGNTTYAWVANSAAVSSSGWTELSGTFAIPSDCVSPGLLLYAEGSGAGVDLYIDNVNLTTAP